MRLNLGCGPDGRGDWIDADIRLRPGVDVCLDVTRPLPFADGSFDAIAAIHLLQDIGWMQIPPLLAEIRRVLAPGGTLRLAVPDLDRAIRAYLDRNGAYFYVPDRDARSVGAKLVTQIVWYGSVRTPCTYEYVEEVLVDAGYADVRRSSHGRSDVPGLAALDNRPRESLFVEADRPR